MSYSEVATAVGATIRHKNCSQHEGGPVLGQVIADVETLDKHQLIAVMTSYLENIYNHSNLALINSEENTWIHTRHAHPANYQKVDMVSIVKGLHIAGKETGTESIKRFRHYRQGVDKSALLFGTIPWEIRDMLHYATCCIA